MNFENCLQFFVDTLQGGNAGGLGGVKHSGADGCHQETSPRKTNGRGSQSFPPVLQLSYYLWFWGNFTSPNLNSGHSFFSDCTDLQFPGWFWPDTRDLIEDHEMGTRVQLYQNKIHQLWAYSGRLNLISMFNLLHISLIVVFVWSVIYTLHCCLIFKQFSAAW